MTTQSLIDPTLRAFFETFPHVDFDTMDLEMIRKMVKRLEVLNDPDEFGVARQEIFIAGAANHPKLRCLLYAPIDAPSKRPAFLHLHGGGYVLGGPEGSDVRNTLIASKLNASVLSVDYRLAPEHPAPAALEDAEAALRWLFHHTDDMSIDPTRIAIGGESAGGGLAVALALKMLDDNTIAIKHQQLVYPMLDDRTHTDATKQDRTLGEFGWTRAQNRFGWDAYLGGQTPTAPVVPARAENLVGLPPAWIAVGALDLFLDENITYARRLVTAGVATEMQIYPGAPHGFPLCRDAAISQRYQRDYLAALARGLNSQE